MTSIAEQRQFYNERWKDFTFANRLKLARCAAVLDGVIATRIYEPRILDLGCGAGWLTSILGIFGPAVGVDLSDAAISDARQRYPHVQFLQADIFHWDYPRGAFDVVTSQEVIEHVEDQAGYLAIAHGLLRSGGHLILTTPNAATFRAMPPEQDAAWDRQPLENTLSIGRLKALLRPDFQIVRISTVIAGYGGKGLYRLASSERLWALAARLGLDDFFDLARRRLGYGRHIYALARKR